MDATPDDSVEFEASELAVRQAIDPEVVERVDLLSVVRHELGHVIGLEDLDALAENLMSSHLDTGERRFA